MKYLKSYESINDYPQTIKTLKELKKYCIWVANFIELIEILEIDREIHCKTLYELKNGSMYKNSYEDESNFTEDRIPLYVKYTSNNLNDCLKILQMLSQTTKYNL